MRVNYFFSLIMILLLISFSSIISSENVLAKEADDEQTEVNEKEDTGSDDEDASEEEVEVIDKLSLEDAIEYNEKSNFSLLKLENNLNNVKSQLAGTEDKYRDLKFDIRDLEREMDRLRKYGSATFDARYEIQEMLKELDDVKQELEEGIEGLTTQEKITEYMNEQTEKSLPTQVTSSYIQLMMQEEQINLLNDRLDIQTMEAENLKLEYELGKSSRRDYEKAVRDIEEIEAEIENAKENLKNEITTFCLDIGIVCADDVSLEQPTLGELTLVEQEIETDELIENSYSMKIAEEQLALERFLRDQVYDDDDADKFDREQADLKVEQEEIEIEELRRDAKSTINELYGNVKDQFYSIEDAEREIRNLKEDISDMKTRYEIGVVSKQEYDMFTKQLTQLEIAKKLEEYQYYLLLEQVDLLELGIGIEGIGSSASDDFDSEFGDSNGFRASDGFGGFGA